MSATAPAASERNSSGKVDDAAIKPTHIAESVSFNISHDAATAWRNDPTLEKIEATQSVRKRRIRSGATVVIE
jgi:hypothetical protein